MESSAKIVASVMDEYVWSTDGIILTGEHGSTQRKMCPITSLSATNHTDNLPVRFQVFQVMCNGLNRLYKFYLFRRNQVVVKSIVLNTYCCNFVASTQQNDVRSEIFVVGFTALQ